MERLLLGAPTVWALLAAVFSLSNLATAEAAPGMTVDALMALIRDDAQTGQSPAQSIEELLPRLPAEMRSHFTLVRESRSLQGATPLAPRAILFDDRMIIAFNGSADQKGYSNLEFIAFDPTAGKTEFRSIEFAAGQTPRLSEANPRRCTGCHGADPRPNWDSYSTWPGLYGSNDDVIAPKSPEVAEIQAFARLAPSHARYRHLIFPTGSPVAPYRSADADDSYALRPNLALTKVLTRMNLARVSRIAHASPLFAKYRVFALYRLLECDPFESLDGLKWKRWTRELAADLAAQGKTAEGNGIAAVMTVLGVGGPDWSLRFGGADFYSFNDGSSHPQDFLAAALLREIAADAPEFASDYRDGVNLRAYYYAYASDPFYAKIDALGAAFRGSSATVCRKLEGKL